MIDERYSTVPFLRGEFEGVHDFDFAAVLSTQETSDNWRGQCAC